MAFLDELERLHEGQYLEFKEATYKIPDDLWETYSAFANAGGGEIVLGVRERQQPIAIGSVLATAPKKFVIEGVQDPYKLRDSFWSSVRDPAQVSADVMLPDDISPIEVEGKQLLVIHVPRAQRTDKPVKVLDRHANRRKGQQGMAAFIRRGEGDFRCTRDELDRMRHDASLQEADGLIIEEMGLDVFNEGTIETYRSLLAARTPPHPWAREQRDDLLLLLKAIRRGQDGELHPTMAGLLAFGDEYQILSFLATYHLDYRAELHHDPSVRWTDRFSSMSGEWSGNLIDFYLGTTQRIDRELPRPFGLTANGMRHDSRSAINDAIHEAVANALVHAYYGAESHITVVLEPDRVRVTNPGTFLLDRDVAIAGGSPMARNPILVRIFSIAGITDVAGSGLRSMYRTWREWFDREPVLTEMFRPDAVEMELPLDFAGRGLGAGGRGDEESDHDGRGSDGDDCKRRRGPYVRISKDEIVEACRTLGQASVTDIASLIGMGASTASHELRLLVDDGVLKRERVGRKYIYSIA